MFGRGTSPVGAGPSHRTTQNTCLEWCRDCKDAVLPYEACFLTFHPRSTPRGMATSMEFTLEHFPGDIVHDRAGGLCSYRDGRS